MTVEWKSNDSKEGRGTRAVWKGLHLIVQEAGPLSTWEIRKPAKGITMASGMVTGENHFSRAMTDAEQSLVKIVRQRIYDLRRERGVEDPEHIRKLMPEERILLDVAAHYRITVKQLTEKGGSTTAFGARGMAMYRLRTELGWSGAEIGYLFGGLSDSSVSQLIAKWKKIAA